MKDQEMYHGFSKEKQADYQKYLINRFGDQIEGSIKESNEKVKKMSKEDFEKSGKDWVQILDDLAKLWKKQASFNSIEVQKIIRRHYEWLKKYWTPDRVSYAGMGEGYTGFEWKDAFKTHDPEHPKLAQFLAEGMKFFAERELS